jgi:hypothetical protein
MGDLSNLERGQIDGVRWAGTSVIKTATLLGVSRATVFKIVGIHKSWQYIISEEDSGQKSTLTERDCCTV